MEENLLLQTENCESLVLNLDISGFCQSVMLVAAGRRGEGGVSNTGETY